MTTYVFTACDKHNVKRFSLTSVTETLTGKSWIKRLQNTQSEAAARRDVNHLKKTPEELSRSDFWRRPRNAFGNGMRGLGKSVRDTSHLLAQQLEVGWVSGLWVGNKKMLKLLRLWKLKHRASCYQFSSPKKARVIKSCGAQRWPSMWNEQQDIGYSPTCTSGGPAAAPAQNELCTLRHRLLRVILDHLETRTLTSSWLMSPRLETECLLPNRRHEQQLWHWQLLGLTRVKNLHMASLAQERSRALLLGDQQGCISHGNNWM